MSKPHEIRQRLAARDRFTLAEVRRWMADDSSLELWSAVCDLLGPGWQLIRPEPDLDETCEFMAHYLLRCIHENVQCVERDVPTGYEAAYTLAACLKHWASKLPETHTVLSFAAQQITRTYLAADNSERDRLLNGLLEHALEAKTVRPYFASWQADPMLADPLRLAMEWAVEHGDPADA